jgi:hypothetical protein
MSSICSPYACAESPLSPTSCQLIEAACCGSRRVSRGASVIEVGDHSTWPDAREPVRHLVQTQAHVLETISLATATTGTVGCRLRKAQDARQTVPSRYRHRTGSATAAGSQLLQLSAARRAADFSLQVLTNARYFWRLS